MPALLNSTSRRPKAALRRIEESANRHRVADISRHDQRSCPCSSQGGSLLKGLPLPSGQNNGVSFIQQRKRSGLADPGTGTRYHRNLAAGIHGQRGPRGVRGMTLPVDDPEPGPAEGSGSEGTAEGSGSGGAVAGPLIGRVIEVEGELDRVAGRADVAGGTGANMGAEPVAHCCHCCGWLTAEFGLDVFQGGVQVADAVVAALGIAGVRERVGLKAAHPALEDDDMHVLDEIAGGRAAMASNTRQLTVLDRLDERPEVGGAEPVDSFRVDHGAIGEDLQQHAELAAVVRAAQGHAGQERVGSGDRTTDARPGAESGLSYPVSLKGPEWMARPKRSGPPAGVGFGTRDAVLPVGKNELPVPSRRRLTRAAGLPDTRTRTALAEFADDVDDDDDDVSAHPEEPAEKPVSSAWAEPGGTQGPAILAPRELLQTFENTPRIADLLAGSLRHVSGVPRNRTQLVLSETP